MATGNGVSGFQAAHHSMIIAEGAQASQTAVAVRANLHSLVRMHSATLAGDVHASAQSTIDVTAAQAISELTCDAAAVIVALDTDFAQTNVAVNQVGVGQSCYILSNSQ